jgi:hypothetical protein
MMHTTLLNNLTISHSMERLDPAVNKRWRRMMGGSITQSSVGTGYSLKVAPIGS